MELNLAGKTVVVTGGGSNIGRGIVLGFAREGSNVVIADRDEEQAQKVASEANALDGKALAVKCDVLDIGSVDKMFKKSKDEFGEVDVLVNNVGWVEYSTFRKKSMEESEREINLNINSTLNCTKSILEHMIEKKSGRIINISSTAGLYPLRRVTVYSLCKGGIISFTKSLAREVGRYNINVNAICPSTTLPEDKDHSGKFSMTKDNSVQSLEFTEAVINMQIKQHALGRLGKPEDLANAAVFLASDAARFISGEVLAVSGGFPLI